MRVTRVKKSYRRLCIRILSELMQSSAIVLGRTLKQANSNTFVIVGHDQFSIIIGILPDFPRHQTCECTDLLCSHLNEAFRIHHLRRNLTT